MTSRQVEKISRLVQESRSSTEPLAPSDEARAAAIRALETELRARAHRKRIVRISSVAAIAAAVAITIGFVSRHHRGADIARSIPAPTPSNESLDEHHEPTPVRGLALADGTVLEVGSRIVSQPSHHASLAFASGTTLTVRNGGDLTLVEADAMQKFMLANGAFEAHVAKLHDGERFVVATADAEVEVRGTIFEVSIVDADPSCGDGTRTRVSVREGVVSVRSGAVDVRVAAGESWPRGCGNAAAPHVFNVIPSPSSAASTVTLVDAPKLDTPTSTLGKQNDAFAHAVLLRQRGDVVGAVNELDAFVATYPSSPLVESARVEQIRALHASDPARAARLARDYVARYPSGFARAEAEAIAAGK